jgi:multicomponent Na+:H+ antiporter subunit E
VIVRFSLYHEPGQSAFAHLNRIPGIILRAVRYVFWLLGRIFISAIHVSKLILSREMPVVPEVISHKTVLKNDLEKVIFAHSITLTPGTITADITGDVLTVHRLDKPSSQDIESRLTERKIREIFGSEKES